MRILLINQYFPPDGGATAHLLGELAEDLTERHSVHVITGRPSYPAPPSELQPDGVRVTRVPSTSFGHGTLFQRALNYLTFSLLASIAACGGPRPDVIVTVTNPPFIGLAGVLAAARHRSRFVLISHDVFPDLAVALGRLHNRGLTWCWRRVNAVIRGHADRIIVVGRDMAERLRAQGVDERSLAFIPAWADRQEPDAGATSALRAQHGWDDRFVVMHAGNLGLAQNVPILADLAERLRARPEVLIAVLGDGPSRPALERAVHERGLGNVELLGALPRTQAQRLMAAADLHLVTLVPGLWGCSAPSKTYGIMAAGRPFVAAVDSGSEPDRLAAEIGCGRRVPAGDVDALTTAVLALCDRPRADLDKLGERGQVAVGQHFLREHVTPQIEAVLTQP